MRSALSGRCVGRATLLSRGAHLHRLVGHYLSDRKVLHQTRDDYNRRNTVCGVHQGSVLGPYFGTWDLTGTEDDATSSDGRLRLRGCDNCWEAAQRASVAEDMIVHCIRLLGLKVALRPWS